MGVVQSVLATVFGGGRNALAETVELFHENEEAAAQRSAARSAASLSQFAAEFALERKGFFDRFMDALNRVPRPALALGTIGLFVVAMVDPVWFAARMQGIALVPEPLWWLMGAIVSFYFGARYQVKSQDFQASLTNSMSRVGKVADNIAMLGALQNGTESADDNAALDDWMASQ